MEIEVILLIASASFSIVTFIGAAKISWTQNDIQKEIREIKNKLNSL